MLLSPLVLTACDAGSEDNSSKQVPASEVQTRMIGLPNGATITVEPGSAGEMLAVYLDSEDPAPRSFELGEIQFGDWSSDTTPIVKARLVDLVQLLKAYPRTVITLIGHSDGVGDPDDNMRISLERAKAAKTALVEAGIGGRRINVDGAGITRPIADNATVEGRARNRRVELVVTAK